MNNFNWQNPISGMLRTTNYAYWAETLITTDFSFDEGVDSISFITRGPISSAFITVDGERVVLGQWNVDEARGWYSSELS